MPFLRTPENHRDGDYLTVADTLKGYAQRALVTTVLAAMPGCATGDRKLITETEPSASGQVEFQLSNPKFAEAKGRKLASEALGISMKDFTDDYEYEINRANDGYVLAYWKKGGARPIGQTSEAASRKLNHVAFTIKNPKFAEAKGRKLASEALGISMKDFTDDYEYEVMGNEIRFWKKGEAKPNFNDVEEAPELCDFTDRSAKWRYQSDVFDDHLQQDMACKLEERGYDKEALVHVETKWGHLGHQVKIFVDGRAVGVATHAKDEARAIAKASSKIDMNELSPKKREAFLKTLSRSDKWKSDFQLTRTEEEVLARSLADAGVKPVAVRVEHKYGHMGHVVIIKVGNQSYQGVHSRDERRAFSKAANKLANDQGAEQRATEQPLSRGAQILAEKRQEARRTAHAMQRAKAEIKRHEPLLKRYLSERPKYLTKDEAEMIYWMNQARMVPNHFAKSFLNPHSKVDEERELYEEMMGMETGHADPLISSSSLHKTAQVWARQSGTRGGRGHQPSDKMRDRFERAGIELTGNSWAENIAYGEMTPLKTVVMLLIDKGVESRGHRINIFSPKFRCVGVSNHRHNSKYRLISVHNFSAKCDDLSSPNVESAYNPDYYFLTD